MILDCLFGVEITDVSAVISALQRAVQLSSPATAWTGQDVEQRVTLLTNVLGPLTLSDGLAVASLVSRLGQAGVAKQIMAKISGNGDDRELDDVFGAFLTDSKWSCLFYLDPEDLWTCLDRVFHEGQQLDSTTEYLRSQSWKNLVHLLSQLNQAHR